MRRQSIVGLTLSCELIIERQRCGAQTRRGAAYLTTALFGIFFSSSPTINPVIEFVTEHFLAGRPENGFVLQPRFVLVFDRLPASAVA